MTPTVITSMLAESWEDCSRGSRCPFTHVFPPQATAGDHGHALPSGPPPATPATANKCLQENFSQMPLYTLAYITVHQVYYQ